MFLNENTLSGNKLLVYIILKILKKCTDAKIQSFQLKFAVHTALSNARYQTENIGESLHRVLRYRTIRGKFSGVEKSLADLGVKKVQVTYSGLHFVM